MLASLLSRVAKEFVFQRAKAFKNNELAQLIRRDLVEEAQKLLVFRNEDYKLKGSAGAGNWASVPWLGFFDPLITESAQKGFYVVFLINVQTEEIYLSLNQGTTEVYRLHGESRGREILSRQAQVIRDVLSDFEKQMPIHEIKLGSEESLPAGYEAGHSLGFKFDAKRLNDSELDRSLQIALDAYSKLIERGYPTPIDTMMEEAGTTDITECRRYVYSRRIERSPKVRREVLSTCELVCQACGLDPKRDYSFQGKPENTPLEVHHLFQLRTSINLARV